MKNIVMSFRGQCVKKYRNAEGTTVVWWRRGCCRRETTSQPIVRNGIPRMRAITFLQRCLLISRGGVLMQKHGKKTRMLNAADPEKAGLCDEGEEDPAARYAVVPLKTEKRV